MKKLKCGLTKKQVNEFITKVFNYYNGRINPFNKCALSINWGKSNGYGSLSHPNCVTIYASTFDHRDQSIFAKNVIHVVIHELYHADAVEYPDEYYGDKCMWDRLVEFPVYKETAKYILSHLSEIVWLSDGMITSKNFDPGYHYKQLLEFSGFDYIKKDMYNHVICALTDMARIKYGDHKDMMYFIINDAINNKKGHLTLISLDGDRCEVIKSGKFVCSMEEFNAIANNMIKTLKDESVIMDIFRLEDSYVEIKLIKRTEENETC